MFRLVFNALLLSATFSAHAQSLSPELEETMLICEQMDKFADAAVRERDANTPKSEAINGALKAWWRQMAVPRQLKLATSPVIEDIFRRIYANKRIGKDNFVPVIVAACSKYGGYKLDIKRIAALMAERPKSAWQPLVIVSRCEKTGDLAADVARARDSGTSREQVATLTAADVDDDPVALQQIPAIVAAAFDNPDLDGTSLFFYFRAVCNGEKSKVPFGSLVARKTEMLACQALPDRAATMSCRTALFDSRR